MEIDRLQKEYPRFIYDNFHWRIEGADFLAGFRFLMGDIEFCPKLIIHNIVTLPKNVSDDQITNFVFHLGLAEIPSYWKAACSPVIEIRAGHLDKRQVHFWEKLIEKGMAQFFYENNLPYILPEFIISAPKRKISAVGKKFRQQYLVPLGGGKDSLVTLELLRESKKELQTFTLNANAAVKKLITVSAAKNVYVTRTIDRKLIELNQQGFLNGHTPFSAILSFLSVFLAALSDCKFVAISQEQSSNEGNVRYSGRDVNHQYSKSIEFENAFRGYSKKYLAGTIDYFSFLRPLHELQIAKIFSRFQKYLPFFLSCNKTFTLAARDRGDNGWCGQCSKCLSLYVMLFPFLGEIQTNKIFGKNLFEDEKLITSMLDLTGQGGRKPFECVGTFSENLVAFYLSWKKISGRKPVLIGYFEKNIMPKYPQLETMAGKMLISWSSDNNVPESLQRILKNEIVDNNV